MTEKEILKKVADAVTEEPITIKLIKKGRPNWITKMPVLLRFFRFMGFFPEKTITVNALTLGTVYRISALINELNIPQADSKQLKEWIYGLIEDNSILVCSVISTAIWNKKGNVPQSLTEWVFENFTLKEIYEVMAVLVDNIDIGSFTATIVSVRSVNILSPEEASRQDTREIIAPGAESGLQ